MNEISKETPVARQETTTVAPAVYRAINKVQSILASEGISKGRKNQQQGYQFRGIDDIYNALSSVMAEAGLAILPSVMERNLIERESKSGGTLFYVTVKVCFDFVSSEDGSSHTVVTYGEAMDSGDKATNKAMSAAYKYACLQAFCIPTEGDNDADALTHEVAPQKKQGKIIGPDQVIEIDDLLTETKTDRDKFLAFYGAKTLDTFPSLQYAHALKVLQDKRNKMKEAAP